MHAAIVFGEQNFEMGILNLSSNVDAIFKVLARKLTCVGLEPLSKVRDGLRDIFTGEVPALVAEFGDGDFGGH